MTVETQTAFSIRSLGAHAKQGPADSRKHYEQTWGKDTRFCHLWAMFMENMFK